MHQALAVFSVPVQIEATDEVDRSSDSTPGAITEVRRDIRDAAFHLYFVLANVVPDQCCSPRVWLANAHEQVHQRRFTGAIRSDECTDRATRHSQGEGTQCKREPESLAQPPDVDCVS